MAAVRNSNNTGSMDSTSLNGIHQIHLFFQLARAMQNAQNSNTISLVST